MRPIFFDYASTTPVDPRVAEEMQRFMTIDGYYANASSKHILGSEVEEELILAKSSFAKNINADVNDIIWTSGATESINFALKSFVGSGILTSKLEHKATLETCAFLSTIGKNVVYAGAEKFTGKIEEKIYAQLEQKNDFSLLSICLINNELGNILDTLSFIPKVRKISPDMLIHLDASQALGKIPIDVQLMDADMMSFSSHKLYGPKGIGALYIKKHLKNRLVPLIHGGGQEYGLRSGTYPNHQIIGFSKALSLAIVEMKENQNYITELSDLFIKTLEYEKINFHINKTSHHLPNILSITLPIDSDILLSALPDFAVSTGSACSGANIEISHVLAEILPRKEALNTIRVSFGKYLKKEEVAQMAKKLATMVANFC